MCEQKALGALHSGHTHGRECWGQRVMAESFGSVLWQRVLAAFFSAARWARESRVLSQLFSVTGSRIVRSESIFTLGDIRSSTPIKTRRLLVCTTYKF